MNHICRIQEEPFPDILSEESKVVYPVVCCRCFRPKTGSHLASCGHPRGPCMNCKMTNARGHPLAYANQDLGYLGLWTVELNCLYFMAMEQRQRIAYMEQQLCKSSLEVDQSQYDLMTSEPPRNSAEQRAFKVLEHRKLGDARAHFNRILTQSGALEDYMRSYGVDIEQQMAKLRLY